MSDDMKDLIYGGALHICVDQGCMHEHNSFGLILLHRAACS